jgi:hypothetical protein
MSVFDFFLVGLSLAPLGLFILFWKLFQEDRGVHPIYRESTTQTTKLEQRSRTRLHASDRRETSNANGKQPSLSDSMAASDLAFAKWRA